MAENGCRKGMFKPGKGASLPVSSAFPIAVGEVMSGNLYRYGPVGCG
jgi:hypothetical protein